MAISGRDKAIKALNEYIWTLKERNENICELNKDIILQYCRFAVLAEEMSVKIQKFKLKEDASNIQVADAQLSLYAKYNKFMIQLYKTLKLDSVKNDLKNFKNPYMELLKENDEDF